VKQFLQVKSSSKPIGRFAPSPTGDLHFGSLVAALGSFLNIRSRGGEWLVRVENIDPPREVEGAGLRQIETLEQHGLISDREVVWQIDSTGLHKQAIDYLLKEKQAFHCACTRAELPPNGVYPGTCRQGLPAGKSARSIRLRVNSDSVEFDDAIQGHCVQLPANNCGDFVIRRADGLIAYQLAVVVDDIKAGVTEVVRGFDLIESTGRQILVYRALGLTPPSYGHLPLITNDAGRKLSKSDNDDPIQNGRPEDNIRLALACLGHPPPTSVATIAELLDWALTHWRIDQVPNGPLAWPNQPC